MRLRAQRRPHRRGQRHPPHSPPWALTVFPSFDHCARPLSRPQQQQQQPPLLHATTATATAPTVFFLQVQSSLLTAPTISTATAAAATSRSVPPTPATATTSTATRLSTQHTTSTVYPSFQPRAGRPSPTSLRRPVSNDAPPPLSAKDRCRHCQTVEIRFGRGRSKFRTPQLM